jgi:hypothetical protein
MTDGKVEMPVLEQFDKPSLSFIEGPTTGIVERGGRYTR